MDKEDTDTKKKDIYNIYLAARDFSGHRIDLNKIIAKNKEEYEFKTVKIVANLPYYITTPIIMKLLEDRLNLDSIIIMIQQEVAQRIVAIPGTKMSGAITYGVYYYAQAESIVVVPNEAFVPAA